MLQIQSRAEYTLKESCQEELRSVDSNPMGALRKTVNSKRPWSMPRSVTAAARDASDRWSP